MSEGIVRCSGYFSHPERGAVMCQNALEITPRTHRPTLRNIQLIVCVLTQILAKTVAQTQFSTALEPVILNPAKPWWLRQIEYWILYHEMVQRRFLAPEESITWVNGVRAFRHLT